MPRRNLRRPVGGWAGESEAERRSAGYVRIQVRLPPADAARLERLRRGRPLVEVIREALEALDERRTADASM